MILPHHKLNPGGVLRETACGLWLITALQQRVAAISHLSDADVAAHWTLAGAEGIPQPAFSLSDESAVDAEAVGMAGGDSVSSELQYECHFLLKFTLFRGVFLHSLCIFNRKFRNNMAFVLQSAVIPRMSLKGCL